MRMSPALQGWATLFRWIWCSSCVCLLWCVSCYRVHGKWFDSVLCVLGCGCDLYLYISILLLVVLAVVGK